MPKISRHVAEKEHECTHCRGVIHKGEEYKVVLWIEPEKDKVVTRTRFHLPVGECSAKKDRSRLSVPQNGWRRKAH